MSRNKTKFWVVAVDLATFRFSVLEIFKAQADKILKAIDNSLSMFMRYLEFRYGTLCIKDMEMLLSYKLYENKPPPEKMKPKLQIRKSGWKLEGASNGVTPKNRSPKNAKVSDKGITPITVQGSQGA